MTTLTHAPVPAGEAADPITPNGATAYDSPSPRANWTLAHSLQRLLTAAGSRCRALRDAFAAWLKDVCGPVEFETSVYRRGYFGEAARCRVCRLDVHDLGEMCSNQHTGQCDICGPVLMDYYGCPQGRRDRNHRIVGDVHPTTEREWQRTRRPRLALKENA